MTAIERLKRWWTKDQRRQIGIVESDQAMSDQELTDTRSLIKESKAKLAEADVRLDNYQQRIRAEYRKRLAIAAGGKQHDS